MLGCLLIPAVLAAQEFSYVHYDTKDGLAGSTVYNMCQDKDGFLWFATENGLSRYDGTHFKNFTVKDGLPDNEVLKVFTDSKGRVWIGTFSKEICFYFNGKIHTRENDSLVKKIKLSASLYSIAEDNFHYLGMSDNSSAIIITPSDSVIMYNLNHLYTKEHLYGGKITKHYGKLLLGSENEESFEYNPGTWAWNRTDVFEKGLKSGTRIKMDSFARDVKATRFSNQYTTLFFPGKCISAEAEDNYPYYVNTTDGAWEIDTIGLRRGNHYLPGKKISWTLQDREKNLWFTSFGEGIFKLPSQSIRTIQFSPDKRTGANEVYSVIESTDGILAGTEGNRAKLVDTHFNIREMDYSINEMQAAIAPSATNRLYTAINISNSITVLGFDKFLVKLENGNPFLTYLYPIKSVAKINSDFIIVGTSSFAFKLRLYDLKITDTIWRERCTKVFYYDQSYYIGTLNGLYEVKEDKSYTYLGGIHAALGRRITDIKSSADSTLWVSTSDNGIVAIKRGQLVKAFTDSNGLSSNNCKTIFIEGTTLWIGTDKGINKLNIGEGQYNISKYSTSDGLPSNVINTILVKDNMVWVGSPAGLTYFNENSISNSSFCDLKMLGIYVSGKELARDSVINLSYKNNNINFEFIGISFRSGGEITYHYKLDGLDKEWKTTTDNTLDYKSLPAGYYKLELYAVNKYGIKSNLLSTNFSIAAPFWNTLWFYMLVTALGLAVVGFLFNRRYKKTKQRLEEKNNLQKQFAALEQQALQSQMNPHFIFNCLNSIQQYILTNEKGKANRYLSGFASLIRQTLDISAHRTIPVSEEASYLRKYLEMERMRFGDSFDYVVHIDDNVNAEQIHMPALLLQPYVENSIRHGIRYKSEGAGKVEISFSLREESLYCTIKDNGAGRDKAAEFKSKQHIEYQSKGMSLTDKRIELLNLMNASNISVAVIDLKNDDDSAAGTLVEINIPVKYEDYFGSNN